MSIRPVQKRLVVFGSILALAAAVTAGAAGGSASRSTDLAPIQHAVTKSSKAASEKTSFVLMIASTDKSLPSGTFTISGSGAIDNRHQAAKITIDLGPLAAALGGVAGGTVPQKIDIVLVKGVLYAHIPAIAKTVSAGKEWLKLDPATVSKSSTGGVDPNQLKSLNPTQVLSSLTSATVVTKLGSATIGGTPVTHYRVSVNPTAAVKALPKAQRAQALKSIHQLGVKTVPVDVYVGKAGYLRRVESTLAEIKAQKGSAGVTIKASLDLSDYGVKVHAVAPPARKVADANKLVEKLLAGLKGG